MQGCGLKSSWAHFHDNDRFATQQAQERNRRRILRTEQREGLLFGDK